MKYPTLLPEEPKILWFCTLPRAVRDAFPELASCQTPHDVSWILGHLPPPPGVELHIACPVTRGPWRVVTRTFNGAQFHLVRCPRGRMHTGYLLDYLFLRNIYRRVRPDLVHGWGTESSFASAALRLAPRRCVVQVQGLMNEYLPYRKRTWHNEFIAWRERAVLRRAPVVFVESGYSGEITRPYCRPDVNLCHVDHPLRPAFFHSTPSTRESRQALFLGHLLDRKGYRDAVQAFADGAPAGWSLLMVGGGTSAAVRDLRSTIERCRGEDRIRHIEHATPGEITEHMKASSVFLLPSYMDTGPTALKEALAMGLWPVCYDNSGPGDFIRRFGFGTLTETGSVPRLTAALRNALTDQPWEEVDMIEKVELARRAFLPATIWKHLVRIYSEIIAAPFG